MKKILLAFLFCLIGSIAGAQTSTQTSKPILCFPISQLLKEMKQLGEAPQWAGSSNEDDSYYTLLVNPKDNTWTLIQFNGELGCVLGIGKDSKLLFKMI